MKFVVKIHNFYKQQKVKKLSTVLKKEGIFEEVSVLTQRRLETLQNKNMHSAINRFCSDVRELSITLFAP